MKANRLSVEVLVSGICFDKLHGMWDVIVCCFGAAPNVPPPVPDVKLLGIPTESQASLRETLHTDATMVEYGLPKILCESDSHGPDSHYSHVINGATSTSGIGSQSVNFKSSSAGDQQPADDNRALQQIGQRDQYVSNLLDEQPMKKSLPKRQLKQVNGIGSTISLVNQPPANDGGNNSCSQQSATTNADIVIECNPVGTCDVSGPAFERQMDCVPTSARGKETEVSKAATIQSSLDFSMAAIRQGMDPLAAAEQIGALTSQLDIAGYQQMHNPVTPTKLQEKSSCIHREQEDDIEELAPSSYKLKVRVFIVMSTSWDCWKASESVCTIQLLLLHCASIFIRFWVQKRM